jgi:hypothetical protein
LTVDRRSHTIHAGRKDPAGPTQPLDWCTQALPDPVRRLLLGVPARFKRQDREKPNCQAQFSARKPMPTNRRGYGPCPGYVADHVIPLRRDGVDTVENMRWQTIEEAKAQDREE